MFSNKFIEEVKKHKPMTIARSSATRELYQEVKDRTSFLGEIPLKQRIYHIVNNLSSIPKCKTCNLNDVKWKTDKYRTFCSSKCSMGDEGVKKSYRESMKEKYGVDNPFKSEAVQEKIKETLFDRYGVEDFNKIEGISKRKIDGLKKTNLERYGVEDAAKLYWSVEKRKETFNEKFDGGHPLRDGEVMAKLKETNLKKYGVENTFQIEDIRKKRNSSVNEKTYKHLIELMDGKFEALFDQKDYHGRLGCEYEFKCCKCLSNFKCTFSSSIITPRCYKCEPYNKSKAEIEIADFLKEQNINFKNNTRKIISPYELDFYISEKEIAIEFNGLYWHSYDQKETKEEKNYHLMKTDSCREKNIHLLHIFESEWNEKKKIWKSIIRSKLGNSNRVYARKCRVALVDRYVKNDFLEENHLQGKDNSSVRVGLYYSEELVAIMTFGKPRFNNNYEWELIRYCSLANNSIVGGASKLLSYFRKNYNGSIISYANKRHSDGNLYKKLGFEYLHDSPPNYYYFKNRKDKLLSRNKCQKHKLKGFLDNFNKDMTESENMFNNGYRRIWDCGNMVFIIV